MKSTSFLILILAVGIGLSSQVKAQPFAVDTIMHNGPRGERINLVVLADGFTDIQRAKFIQKSRLLAENLLDQIPFRHYKRYFNVYSVFRASADSGAMHPHSAPDCFSDTTVRNPTTQYGSTFDYGGIHRLLVPTLASRITATLAGSVPDYDLALVLVNSPVYGGSGGTFPTASLEFTASEVVNHEVGHSFGALADEYWAGAQYAREYPNMTANSNTATVKWNAWLGFNQVGVYPFSEAPNWFRPHPRCKMRTLNYSFCPVCQEALVERIHALVAPIEGLFSGGPVPMVNADTCLSGVRLKVPLIRPEPNTLKVTWQITGQPLSYDTVFTVPCSMLASPGHTLVQVVVQDTTALVRTPGHRTDHIYLMAWDLNRTVTGSFEVLEHKHALHFTLFPNPGRSSQTQVLVRTEKPISMLYRMVSATGAVVWTSVETTVATGESAIGLPLETLPLGVYRVEALHEGQTVWTGNLVKE